MDTSSQCKEKKHTFRINLRKRIACSDNENSIISCFE